MLLTEAQSAERKEGEGYPGLLVTGSSGFIGTHFLSRYGGSGFSDVNGTVDLTDKARVEAAIMAMKPLAVLHLAAQSSVASSFKNPLETYGINFLGTLNLLEALSNAGFSGVFLFVSSADIYGSVEASSLPVAESLPARPRSPYAVSKVAAEALCYQWSQTHSFRTIVVRPFNQIGPGQDVRFAVPHFAYQVSRIRRGLQPPLISTGDIEVTRDFTDVRDSVRALKLLLDGGRNGEVYNICSGRERSLSSILNELLELAGVEAKVRMDPAGMRPGEQRRMVGSPAKLTEDVGWEPGIDIRTTLQEILRDMENK